MKTLGSMLNRKRTKKKKHFRSAGRAVLPLFHPFDGKANRNETTPVAGDGKAVKVFAPLLHPFERRGDKNESIPAAGDSKAGKVFAPLLHPFEGKADNNETVPAAGDSKAGNVFTPILHPYEGRVDKNEAIPAASDNEASGKASPRLFYPFQGRADKNESSNLTDKNEGDHIQVLTEIVGATNLTPHPDLWTTAAVTPTLMRGSERPASPAVVAKWLSGDSVREVHTTKTIMNCNDPIWVVDTASLFILDIPLKELFPNKDSLHSEDTATRSESAMLFEINDSDAFYNKRLIGTVRFSASEIVRILQKQSEQRIERTIMGGEVDSVYYCNDEGRLDVDDGMQRAKLALRFRLASRQDVKFMDLFQQGNLTMLDEVALACDESTGEQKGQNNGGKLEIAKLATDAKGVVSDMKTKFDPRKPLIKVADNAAIAVNAASAALHITDKDGTIRHRVKPGPDPSNPEETRFLSSEDMLKAVYQPSTNWVEAGSGNSGRVYVEILRCEGLPNMEAGGAIGAALGDKTDAFVSLVYEDAMAQTEVIDNCLSPVFMPWTQRAFAFNRFNPLSPIFLGVFDYDAGSAHDGIGRCVINLENFQPSVIYTLKYGLYQSNVLTDRKEMGTVTIRLQIEELDDKALLLESRKDMVRKEMRWIHVNMRKEKSFSVARYTLIGQCDEEYYDLALLRSYIDELREFKQVILYNLGDALRSIIFWRGQVKVGKLMLPLHSLLAFLIGVYAVENPHRLPSLLCFYAAWLLMGNYTNRARHPSPWRRCRPITDYIKILCVGKTLSNPVLIQAGDGAEEEQALEDAWKSRVQVDLDIRAKRQEKNKELQSIDVQNIQTEQQRGINLDPLSAYLLPVQRRLRKICHVLRRFKCVLSWEESSLSFWWTVLFLSLGVALFVLPTGWLIYWFTKIAVWVCLGPWMKFVDVYFLGGTGTTALYLSKEERLKHREKALQKIANNFSKKSRAARVKNEGAQKLKAMKTLRFGKYIANVPPRNIARHFDYPLPDSTARSFPGVLLEGWENRKILCGQQLHGVMIPLRARELLSDEKYQADLMVECLKEKPKDGHEEKGGQKCHGYGSMNCV